jgi:hypothetical protein
LKKTTNPTGIEKELHKRLKWMGYLLVALALITIIWDFFPTVEDELDLLILEAEEAPPPMNPYIVSSSFALVGTLCFFIYWKKKPSFSDNT